MSSKTLVIILGQLRAHSLTWSNFKKNVLDELDADLAVCVPNDSFFDFANPYYLNARYRWLVPDAADLSGTYDRIRSILKGTEDWRVLCDVPGSWLGRIAQSQQPGAASILYVLRWFMLNNIAAAGLSQVYDRFVITRSDYFYLSPHPPLDCLDLDKLWIPDGENYGGICDRHLVVSSADLVPACNLIDRLLLEPLQVRTEMIASAYCNIERLIELHYRRNGLFGRVRRFPFVMFLVRDEGDPTAWSVGEYLPNVSVRVKYRTELREAERFGPILQSSSDWRLFFAARRVTDSAPPGVPGAAHPSRLPHAETGSDPMAQYHVATIRPEGFVHSDGFLELANALCAALRILGHSVNQGENTIDALATNIVLGAHLLTEEDSKLLPPSTIIFNLEPIGGANLPDWYTGLAARHRIWDSSALNLRHWNLLPCIAPPLLVEIGSIAAIATRPTICGMAVVKNEADVIEASVRHNLRFFDRFVVLEDGSVDDTRSILAKLSKELPKLIVKNARPYGNTQAERMTALLKEQRAEWQPHFAVFLDADEFLDPGLSGDFHALLQAIPGGGYGLYPSCTFVLTPENLQAGVQDILPRMRRRRRQEEPQFYKIIVRLEAPSAADILIEEGNHSARAADGSRLPNTLIPGLRLLHFPIRSRDQFVAKSVIPWMRFLMQNEGALQTQANWHWQACFDRVAEGDAPSEKSRDESVSRASMFFAQQIDSASDRGIDWENDLVEEPFLLCYERRYSSGVYLPALAMIARSWQESILREQEKQRLQRPPQAGQPLGNRLAVLLAGLLKEGRTQEALAFLDKELAAGESCEMLNLRSTLQYSLGDLNEAEKGYQRASELDPNAKEPVTNRLHILLSAGRYAEAVPLIETTRHLLSDGDRQRLFKLLPGAKVDQGVLPLDSFLKQVPGVIHIGANTGQERQLYASLGLNVLWVEPIPAVFEVLRSNIAGFANQRACSYLLAAEHGKQYSLHVADNEGASSSIFAFAKHRLLWPDIQFTHDISVTATTLPRLIEAERIDLRHYGALVLDTQGSELLVLKGAITILDQFRFVKAEVANFESYIGCCQMDELNDFMCQQGFVATAKSLFASRDGVGNYYDVLYSRP